MAFKRREAVIEAVDLAAVSPDDAEKRIISGVKKYATNEPNWSQAGANTPYLGSIIGMGIESSNLADITMSIERQFLTRKTKRVPLEDGSGDFRLEDGELGKLRILDGQDALAATPGLSIKMLMDLGHMPRNESYLQKAASFACITSTGEGYKINDSLAKLMAKIEKLSGSEKDEAKSNLKAIVEQAKSYVSLIGDPQAFAASRRKNYENDKAAEEALRGELANVTDKLKGATASGDSARVAELRADEAGVRARLKMTSAKLRVSKEVAEQAGRRTSVEESLVGRIKDSLSETIRKASSLS